MELPPKKDLEHMIGKPPRPVYWDRAVITGCSEVWIRTSPPCNDMI